MGVYIIFNSFLVFVEFIGVTLVHKTYRFQVYNLIKHHLHSASCTQSPKSLPIPIYPFCPPLLPLLPLLPFPLAVTTLLSVSVCYIHMGFFLIPSPLFIQPSQHPFPLIADSLSIYSHFCFYFVHQFVFWKYSQN